MVSITVLPWLILIVVTLVVTVLGLILEGSSGSCTTLLYIAGDLLGGDVICLKTHYQDETLGK